MGERADTLVFIPAWNEEQNLPAVLDEVTRGLPQFGVAAGYAYAVEHGYAYCGRVDADGQHPVGELARLLERVRSGACDVAVGSRFVSGEGYAPLRYQPSPARVVGTSLLRRGMRRPGAFLADIRDTRTHTHEDLLSEA